MRQYVHERKIALGLTAHESFVPRSYNWASKPRADGWFELAASKGGVPSCGAVTWRNAATLEGCQPADFTKRTCPSDRQGAPSPAVT